MLNIKSDTPFVCVVSHSRAHYCFTVEILQKPLYTLAPRFAFALFQVRFLFVTAASLKDFNSLFVILTGRRTTQRTDKCTGRIMRLCTSVALDGPNLTEKRVVFIVSIPLPYIFPFSITEGINEGRCV